MKGSEHMYKFCKANGGWWFVCKDLEKLFEYKDKTNSRYGLALVNGCEGKRDNNYSVRRTSPYLCHGRKTSYHSV